MESRGEFRGETPSYLFRLWMNVGCPFEVEPAFIAAGKAIKDGKIGKVSFFNMTTVNFVDKSSKWYRTPWRTIPDVRQQYLV